MTDFTPHEAEFNTPSDPSLAKSNGTIERNYMNILPGFVTVAQC